MRDAEAAHALGAPAEAGVGEAASNLEQSTEALATGEPLYAFLLDEAAFR